MLVWLASPLGAASAKGHPASSLGNRLQPDDPIRDMLAEAAAGLHQHCIRLHPAAAVDLDRQIGLEARPPAPVGVFRCGSDHLDQDGPQ